MLNFFFVRDCRREMRFFSSEPPKPPEAGRSKAKEAWELAKRKLMVLPQRMLRQEQAFARALRLGEPEIRILYSGIADAHKTGSRFTFFLQRQRTKRILYLVGEMLLIPLTGLLMPLPGPNVAFYVVALLAITHWLSVRGLRALLKKTFSRRRPCSPNGKRPSIPGPRTNIRTSWPGSRRISAWSASGRCSGNRSQGATPPRLEN